MKVIALGLEFGVHTASNGIHVGELAQTAKPAVLPSFSVSP
jgi:hypothetical protein